MTQHWELCVFAFVIAVYVNPYQTISFSKGKKNAHSEKLQKKIWMT
jgi:hypothetical protein